MLKVSMRPTLRDRPWVMLLAIILIALPTAVFTKMITEDSSRYVVFQTVERPNRATFYGGTCEQDIPGYNFNCTNQGGTPPEVPYAYLVGDGSTTITFGDNSVSAYINGSAAEISILGENTPNADEIVMGYPDAENLGVKVGDTVTLETNPPLHLKVKSLSPAARNLVDASVVQKLDDVSTEYVLVKNSPLTWDDVKELNQLGYVVNSRDVQDNPPPPEQLYPAFPSTDEEETGYDRGAAFLYGIYFAAIYTFIAMILLLLISPVFAVASTRMTKVYALMRSQGATTGSIRIAVATYGLIAGVVSAALGVLGGVIWAVVDWKLSFPTWPVHFPFTKYAYVAIAVILGCVVSAFLPAIFASRTSITAGIEGANSDRLLRWRKWMWIGPAYLALYLVVNFAWRIFLGNYWLHTNVFKWNGSDEHTFALVTIYTILTMSAHLLLIPALALTVPAVVYGLGLIRNPLSAKMGARLLRRQWLKSVPVAAGVAALMFSFTYSMFATETPTRAAELSYSRHFVIEELTADEAPVSHDVRALDYSMNVHVDSPEDSFDEWDFRYSTNISDAIIGTPQVLELFNLSDAERAEAAQALNEGKVLVSKAATQNDTITLQIEDFDAMTAEESGPHRPSVSVAPVLPDFYSGIVLSESTAQELGLRMTRLGEIREKPTGDNNLLFDNEDPTWRVIQGSLIPGGLALVLIAGLSVMESRAVRKLNTQIYALGATPSTLAKVGAWQAGLIAAASSWLGLISGSLVFIANNLPGNFTAGTTALGNFGLPSQLWLMYALLGLGLPLVAAAVGYLFTTSPLARPRSA